VIGELGRFPLLLLVWLNTCKDYSTVIVRVCYQMLFLKVAHCMRIKNSLISTIQLILKHLDIPFSYVYNKNIHHRVRSKLVSIYNLQFNKTLSYCREHEVGKLRSYALMKTNLWYEPYFDIIRNVDIRKCFTCFRLSLHRLQIELGRYKKVPKEKMIMLIVSVWWSWGRNSFCDIL